MAGRVERSSETMGANASPGCRPRDGRAARRSTRPASPSSRAGRTKYGPPADPPRGSEILHKRRQPGRPSLAPPPDGRAAAGRDALPFAIGNTHDGRQGGQARDTQGAVMSGSEGTRSHRSGTVLRGAFLESAPMAAERTFSRESRESRGEGRIVCRRAPAEEPGRRG